MPVDDAVEQPPEGAGDEDDEEDEQKQAQHHAPGFRAAPGPSAGRRRVRRLQAVERALRGLPFRAVGRELDHLLPGLGRAVEILLAERLHDADVQQRLRVLGIELERAVELLRAPCPAGSM